MYLCVCWPYQNCNQILLYFIEFFVVVDIQILQLDKLTEITSKIK